jgi:hypothetical protein
VWLDFSVLRVLTSRLAEPEGILSTVSFLYGLLDKLFDDNLVKKFPVVMEPEGSCSFLLMPFNRVFQ